MFPNLIANSIFVNIFSSCNDTSLNCIVFLNHSVALFAGSIINTVRIELFIIIEFSIDRVSEGNPLNFKFNISLSFNKKLINLFILFLFLLNFSLFIEFIHSLYTFSLIDSL